MADSLTKDWIRNVSDERAVKNGCRFDMERALHVCEFFEEELVLYEGEFAGQPFRLMEWQKEFLMRCFGWVRFSKDWNREVRRFRKASLWVPKKNGKAFALDTLIPTPKGFTTIGEIQVGDKVFDKDGKQCNVIQVHPIWMQEDSYEITFSNGEKVRCCGEHEWVIQNVEGNEFVVETKFLISSLQKFFIKAPKYLDKKNVDNFKSESYFVYITSIKKIPAAMMRCITVDSESSTFLFGKTMLPTHNSPLAAGVGLYLLAADGEEGQKVYSVAKDGKQAKIVHTHAMEMVKRSPNLRDACKINKSTGRILYLPTTSWYDLLSGDNIEGQEGLNGSSITDEKHVVTRRLAKVLEYMGASRAEPLDFGVSTYGNNPDSYGKQDCDYGKAVERGDIDDESFLHQSYELPDHITFEEAGTPEVWKQCNPSYGITIKETEMEAAYNRASRSLVDQNNFMMYRLNKWNTSESPWLRSDDWKKNAGDWKLEDFYGEPVWLALDLSKTRDMSSLCLVFRHETEEDPTFYQFPYFWLPENYANQNSDKVDFLGWSHEGYLEIIPGDTIRQSYIKEKMKWIEETFQVQTISYDKTYSFDLINEFCEPELDWECIEFGQSLRMYAGPTENYEAMLVEGRLKHNNHKVLNWQAGHVQVKTNERGDRMPVKPKRDDVRKIDGIVAGIMALNSAYHSDAPIKLGQCYEDDNFNWIS